MKRKSNVQKLDLVAEYLAEPVVESSWGHESLEEDWLKRFASYLVTRPEGMSALHRLRQHGQLRATIERIHQLTQLDVDSNAQFVDVRAAEMEAEEEAKARAVEGRITEKQDEGRPESKGFAYEGRRRTWADFKDRFKRAEELIGEIEKLAAHQDEDAVNIRFDPLSWPPERERFIQWIETGKKLAAGLHQHFKAISHASREERDDYGFLVTVFALHYRYRCTQPQIAALIASGHAAWGRRPTADHFDSEKLKYDLKRLKKRLPNLYESVESDIKRLADRERHKQ